MESFPGKNSLRVIFITIAALALFAYWYTSDDACYKPITYKIGRIDPKYDISEQELLDALDRAEQVWEVPSMLNLFSYDSQGELSVNLIFDARQQETILEQKTRDDLRNQKGKLENSTERYNFLKKELSQLEDSYKIRASEYKNAVESYNRASARSASTKQKLDRDLQKLRKMESRISSLVNQINNIVKDSQNKVADYNQSVDEFNSSHLGEENFDQGDYDAKTNTITVYQYDNLDDLILLLAHEMGHALGIEHVENPKSVMYFLLDQQNVHPIKASNEDLLELSQHCSLLK